MIIDHEFQGTELKDFRSLGLAEGSIRKGDSQLFIDITIWSAFLGVIPVLLAVTDMNRDKDMLGNVDEEYT